MSNFKIDSVKRVSSDLVEVNVTIDAKTWLTLQAKGQLGQLYGIDISNQVYREHGVKAHNPSVDHNTRVKRGSGVKTIKLSYVDAEWTDKPMGELIKVDFINRRRVA